MTPQFLNAKLVAVPLGMLGGKLHVLSLGGEAQTQHCAPLVSALPCEPLFAGSSQSLTLQSMFLRAAERFASTPGVRRVDVHAAREPQALLAHWFGSPRFLSRVVDVLDVAGPHRPQEGFLEIIRAVAVPDDVVGTLGTAVASANQAGWLDVESALAGRVEGLPQGSLKILAAAAATVPDWTRHGTFAFELLPSVFSIQDLRVLLGHMTSQEIDAGNFHRRLKRLDLLRPMVGGQRVHRWEFDWSKTETLRRESLIP